MHEYKLLFGILCLYHFIQYKLPSNSYKFTQYGSSNNKRQIVTYTFYCTQRMTCLTTSNTILFCAYMYFYIIISNQTNDEQNMRYEKNNGFRVHNHMNYSPSIDMRQT